MEHEPLTRMTEGLLALHSPHGGTGSLLISAQGGKGHAELGGKGYQGRRWPRGRGVLGREERPYSKESRSGCRPSLSRLEVRARGGGLLAPSGVARWMGLSSRPFLSRRPGDEALRHSVIFSLGSSWPSW